MQAERKSYGVHIISLRNWVTSVTRKGRPDLLPLFYIPHFYALFPEERNYDPQARQIPHSPGVPRITIFFERFTVYFFFRRPVKISARCFSQRSSRRMRQRWLAVEPDDEYMTSVRSVYLASWKNSRKQGRVQSFPPIDFCVMRQSVKFRYLPRGSMSPLACEASRGV